MASVCVSPRRTRIKNATQHPGQVILDAQGKRRTKAQVEADNRHMQEVQEAQKATMQRGVSRIAAMEAAMEASQAVQETKKAKPVKPRPKKTMSAKVESIDGDDSKGDKTFNSPDRGADNHAGLGSADKLQVEGVGNVPKSKKTKKNSLPMREAISAVKNQITDDTQQTDNKGNFASV